MGEGLLLFYQTKVKKEYKIAFIVTFFIALMVHLYKFTNTLPNRDAIVNYYSSQNVLGSGRWALSLACGFSSYFDLPWVIGVLSCVLIALTAVVIVALFQMKNPVLIALSGALLAASPTITMTFFFLYTADGYMLAMLLAALAVYFSRIEETRVSRFVLSGICLCVSLGIYQAYLSFALLLALCYFMIALLQNCYEKQACLKWILRQIIIFVLALAIYYLIWQLCMSLTGTVANNYKGISEAGKIDAGVLIDGLISSFKTSILYFFPLIGTTFEPTLYSALNFLFLITMLIGLIVACRKSGIFHRKWALALVLLCLIAICPFAAIWKFAAHNVGYYMPMLQSMTLLFIFTALLYEQWAKPRGKNLAGALLAVIVLNHAVMANISYFYLNLCYERTYAEGLEMMMEIHDFQDDYELNKIAIIGDKWWELPLIPFDEETGKITPYGKIHMLGMAELDTYLFVDGERTVSFLQTIYGLDLQLVTNSELEELISTHDGFQNMGSWPDKGSMAVVDDILVLKFSDLDNPTP